MTLSACLFGLSSALCTHSTAAAHAVPDTVDLRPVHSVHIYSENQWASNAASKWAVAGLAFGGDISTPVRTLTSLTEQRGIGIGGGSTRQGIALVLPSMNLGKEPDMGRWKTTVALEHQQLVTARWTDGMARFFFGRHGIEGETFGSLGLSRYWRVSATNLKIGGERTHRSTVRSTPVDMTLNWSINAGEMHEQQGVAIQMGSQYRWDGDSMAVDLRGSRIVPFGVGTLLSLDLGMTIEEADGGMGRPDRWSISVRDWGAARFREGMFERVDTAYADAGLPILGGEAWDLEGVIMTDTVLGTIRRKMPSTVRIQWDREALRTPGVVWSLSIENNSVAPRPQVELVRSSGRGAVRTTVGIGYGGWGGTYIPLHMDFPSRDVRQGRPGGTLSVGTRWLALPGSGGRMALGANWHQTF